MSDLRFRVDGIPELQAAFAGLPLAIQNDAMRKAIPVAGAMIRDAIKAAAPVGRTGNLRDSIEFRATQIGGMPSGVVVPNRRRGGGGHHAHLVEFGTAPHPGFYFGRPCSHPGARARAFWNPAVDATADAAVSTIIQQVDTIVSAYWAGLGGPP